MQKSKTLKCKDCPRVVSSIGGVKKRCISCAHKRQRALQKKHSQKDREVNGEASSSIKAAYDYWSV